MVLQVVGSGVTADSADPCAPAFYRFVLKYSQKERGTTMLGHVQRNPRRPLAFAGFPGDDGSAHW